MLGGSYQPLQQSDIERIHNAALHILERVGIGDGIPEFVEAAAAAGCGVTDTGRVRIPRGLVEDLIARAPSSITLYGRDPGHDLELSGTRVHFGTAGAAISVLDSHTGQHRPSVLTDLYDFSRLADRLEHIHWFSRTVVPTEFSDPAVLDINTAYATMAGTCKHIGTSFMQAENVAPTIAMFDMVLGGAGRFAARPFCHLHATTMVPPMRFSIDTEHVMVAAMAHGMPIGAITAGQAGATAPATLAGTLVQTTAETLGALTFVQLLSPGHPFIFANWPFVSDLRTGAMSGGSAEAGILNAASAQIANFYDLPSGVAAGMADSKIPDAQAGHEKALTTVLAGLSGANLIYESFGMLASLLACSNEMMVIDNDILAAALRAVRGIEVTDETMAVGVIEEAVNGSGHFLAADQTLAVMESEYIYPRVGDRLSPDDWRDQGSRDVWHRAQHRVRELLSEHYPDHIDPERDAQIRERFDIRLSPDEMSPASRRW
jgi:trimethylamine--corrinoid protein Co-methyltransferase